MCVCMELTLKYLGKHCWHQANGDDSFITASKGMFEFDTKYLTVKEALLLPGLTSSSPLALQLVGGTDIP